MGYKSAFKECMREYEKDRATASYKLDRRKREVYEKLPRVEEIDRELMHISIGISKFILQGGGDASEFAEEMNRLSTSLQQEKAELLKEHQYGEGYFANIYKCALCNDTGFVGNKKCRCLKQRLIDKYYDLSNLRNILEKENFDYFDIRYYSQEPDTANGISPQANIQRIYQICNDFTANFDSNFDNLLFYGDTGLGKTFLCNCIAKDILDAGRTVLYVTAPQIFKVFEDYRFNRDDMEEPDEYIDMVFSVDLLIIDDLGAEFSTVISSSELFNIINTRILEKRHTVISTNLSPNDFETVYSDRIISRFAGNYKMMKFFGQDIRPIKKYSRTSTAT